MRKTVWTLSDLDLEPIVYYSFDFATIRSRKCEIKMCKLKNLNDDVVEGAEYAGLYVYTASEQNPSLSMCL